MVFPKKTLGQEGEKKAEHHLTGKGYTIVGRNQRVGKVEVDILARKGDILCLVEVKTRTSPAFGLPEEFVDQRKRARLIRAAKLLAARKPFRNLRIRFDIISVLVRGEEIQINHIENAFEE